MSQETKTKFEEIYVSGEYLAHHPTWHIETSPVKAADILKLLNRAGLKPETVCEVGCGVGGILAALQKQMDPACSFYGYDISPQAVGIARQKENEKLHFQVADLTQEDVSFDLILMMDMIEHVENCFSFLRNLKPKSQYKIIQFGLDLTMESLLSPNALLGFRSTLGHVGHVHYFTKNIALAMLEDLGYEVMDYFYTPIYVNPAESLKKKILQRMRVLFYSLRKDLAVRVVGGYKLIVLAK
jgi:SAM-dependent methyltransferase